MNQITTPTTSDRIAGALLGEHAGDCLGAAVESAPWAQIKSQYPDGVREIIGGGPWKWPVGHATDDTDLTRALALAYLEALADPDLDVVRVAADLMIDWLRGRWPGRVQGSFPIDVGGATYTGLQRYMRSGDPRLAGAGAGQAGNGSLMRCVPTALVRLDATQRRREAAELSAITHDDERCVRACVAYVELAAALVAGATPVDAVSAAREVLTQTSTGVGEVLDAITQGQDLDLAKLVATGVGIGDVNHGRGYVLTALTLSIAAVLDPRSLEEVLIDVVRVGGDSDTNGAIAGALLGARDGIAAVPQRWIDRLQFGQEFLTIADQITAATRPGA